MQANQLSFWVLAICYIIYFLVSCFAWKEDQLNIDGRNGLLHSLRGINCKHLAGIIVLGLPLLLYRRFWLDLLQFEQAGVPEKIPVVLFLLITAGLLALGKAKKRSRVLALPKTAGGKPDLSEIYSYLFLRTGFLIVYECFFRGLMLTACVAICGIPVAILINLIFYAGIHVFNGYREMLSCILFGLIVCGLVLWDHSVLPAISVHLVMALIYESYLIFLPEPSPKTLTA